MLSAFLKDEAKPSALMYDVRRETWAGIASIVEGIQPCYRICFHGEAELCLLDRRVVVMVLRVHR